MSEFPSSHRRIYEVILEMAGGSPRELVELLLRLRDERPELYRAFVRAAPCGIAPGEPRAQGRNRRGPQARAAW